MSTAQMTIDGQEEPIEGDGMGALNCPKTVHAHVVSFGAGVQSTALAMLVANQDPRLLRALQISNGALPEAFIFADTGDEKQATYEHLWKMAQTLGAAGFPLIIVRSNKARSLSEHVAQKARDHEGGMSTPPFYVSTRDGTDTVPVLGRSCTHTFKARPLDKWAKAYGNVQRGDEEVIAQWRGISCDEIMRMKDHPKRWAFAYYPLIAMGWNREQCHRYLATQTYSTGEPVASVRSACVYCPYHSREEWLSVRASPPDWAKAVALDEELERAWDGPKSIAGLETEPFLTPERKRLRDTDFENAGDLDNWLGECTGLCGI